MIIKIEFLNDSVTIMRGIETVTFIKRSNKLLVVCEQGSNQTFKEVKKVVTFTNEGVAL